MGPASPGQEELANSLSTLDLGAAQTTLTGT